MLRPRRGGHSSGTALARCLEQPTRTASLTSLPQAFSLSRTSRVAIPIRSCSRWGLPCRFRCRTRGALLPHLFTLTASRRRKRFVLCGTFPGVAPAGSYPAPYVDGARTFLSREGAAARPTDGSRHGVYGRWRQAVNAPEQGPKIIIVKMSFGGRPLRLVLDPEVRKHSRHDLMRTSGSKSTSNQYLEVRFGFEGPVERSPRNLRDLQTTALRAGNDANPKGVERCSIC